MIVYSLLFIWFNIFFSNSNDLLVPGYNLARPDKSIVLPAILREVSGITNLDSSTFACVEDEDGVIFFYDIEKKQIKGQSVFNGSGDYEGVARVEKAIYVLRSDGVIFEIADYTEKKLRVNKYVTGIPANNNEGLCYDAENNRLLIACKSSCGNTPELKDRRMVYGFDLKSRKLSAQPVYAFVIADIKKFLQEKSPGSFLKIRKLGFFEPSVRFHPSAICIHPVTKKLYLLSAIDHMIFIFDKAGNLEYAKRLDPFMFNKAEGITFLNNGDMVITNEAQKSVPTLFMFNYSESKL